MASPKESVYLCCHDNNGKNLPLESQIVVFLYAFCDLTAKTCETVLVRNDRVVANDGSQEDSIFHGTGRGLNIKVEEKDVIPACVQKCQLPVLLTNHNGINCCKYGLANVLRNLIYIANDVHPERELLKLLGYNETCLKSCAESSQWTKLCEIEIPESISYFCQHNHRNGTIPFS
ncbi:glutathione S-transferase C-terminal domain-containing protein-like, partial [Saccoglossus kowalevskii]|uniref:Glutathione S-transferase C-terminal domain-containing protein-like n=1 Tax=Saccoglossus kowalevskii TaxID=10224 RepID=A0ABM0MKT1_SACKO